jgi:hypothetical protein
MCKLHNMYECVPVEKNCESNSRTGRADLNQLHEASTFKAGRSSVASKSDGLGDRSTPLGWNLLMGLGSKATKIEVGSLPDFVSKWFYSVSANGPSLFPICQ